MTEDFSQFRAALTEHITASASSQGLAEEHFNDLALRLFRLQYQAVLPYQRYCDAQGATPGAVKHWSAIPPMPTAGFKELELSSLQLAERTTVFYSSGTTVGHSSKHFHSRDSLLIYERSLLPWFTRHLLADWDDLAASDVVGPLDKPGFVILTPSPAEAPNSSLVHMFDTVKNERGSRDSFFGGKIIGGAWELDIDKTLFGLRKSMCANRPITLMGTAFSFVHLLDHFAANNIRYRLARGSRVLETGGYKGRSRELPKAELHSLITRHLGIPDSHIICEYGMSELSSQAYDRSIVFHDPELNSVPAQSPRVFRFPPWARVQLVSPETSREVAEGQTGLIRIYDLANVRSVMAIQTEDLGIRRGSGFELIGRAAMAEPRGCSLMAS